MSMKEETESPYKRAIRVKGYGQEDGSNVLNEDCIGERKVYPIPVDSVTKFLDEIFKLEHDKMNPIYYHAHSDVNYMPIPSVMRTGENLKKEDFLTKEFERRFSYELRGCQNTLEKLAFMRHYELNTRLIDITESPLVALYFATENNDERYAEITLYKEPEEDVAGGKDKVKFSRSTTASIIANTAFLPMDFYLGNIDILFRNDGHLAYLENNICFKDIMCRSVIVRVPRDNPRIINQQGLFIAVNANELQELSSDNQHKDNSFDIKQFNNMILGGGYDNLRLCDLLDKKECSTLYPYFKQCTAWDFCFRKVNPYDINNKYPKMQEDPFDLKRLTYKNEKRESVVFIIPPSAKKTIRAQLESLNINKHFIYPNIENYSHYLNNSEEN